MLMQLWHLKFLYGVVSACSVYIMSIRLETVVLLHFYFFSVHNSFAYFKFWRVWRAPDPGQETKAKMVWPCLKVFWFSKDNPTGHSERKKKKRQTEEEVGRQYQRVDRNGLCQLN